MSKQSSAPISDLASRDLARARRSVRKRSKSMRFSQSTAIVPYVGKAIRILLEVGQASACHLFRTLQTRQTEVCPTKFGYDRLHIALAASNTCCSVGIVASSSGGEKGIGTCIAPIRFTA